MTTTKIAEKEKAIRKKLRIKEVVDRWGVTRFFLQRKFLGIWWTFDDRDYLFIDMLFNDYYKAYGTFKAAKDAIDRYVNYRLSEYQVHYHFVNYLTH